MLEMTDVGDGPEAGGQAHEGEHEHSERLRAALRHIEHLALDPETRLVRNVERRVLEPAWQRITKGEPRWPTSLAIVAAIGMQLALPSQDAIKPRWLLPGLGALLLIGLLATNPGRISRQAKALRAGSMVLIAVLSLANAGSAARLIVNLVRGTQGQDAGPLLLTGGAIWLTNVVVFSLWYWELDRGGPAARAVAPRPHPDFLFPQMDKVELAPPHWEPSYVDYLYVSFTNATAFSPTDVMPLSRWAKMIMMLQSGISVTTVALVVARAVNILK